MPPGHTPGHSGSARDSAGSVGIGAAQQVGALFVGLRATQFVARVLGAAQQVGALFVGLRATQFVTRVLGAAQQVGALSSGSGPPMISRSATAASSQSLPSTMLLGPRTGKVRSDRR